MKQQDHYIEWRSNTSNSLDEKMTEIMKHWQSRYELGTAVLLSETPATTLKNVQKQWRKLTRQMQKVRETKNTAEDILNITRTISRMQRVKFTTQHPDEEPDATFYILKPGEITTLPLRCLTLYSTTELPDSKLFSGLSTDALTVLYVRKQSLPDLKNKTLLEERVQSEEATLLRWLKQHDIDLSTLEDNVEDANEALDTLLASNSLQSEFLHKAKLYLHTVQLAQPIKLSEEQQLHIRSLQRLEKHVVVLSSNYLTDHIIDSSSDDAFLLRDSATGRHYAFNSLKEYIASQYAAGRTHLARALEQQAGFARI